MLNQFELVDPAVVAVQDETQRLYEKLLQYTPTEKTRSEVPPFQVLVDAYEEYLKLHDRAAELLPGIKADLEKWQARPKATDEEKLAQSDQIDYKQQADLAGRIVTTISELESGFKKREQIDRELKKNVEKYHDKPSPVDPVLGEQD